MVITHDELNMYVENILSSIKYENNAFSIYRGEQVKFGTIVDDIPAAQDFFNYATIYNSIVDISNKLNYSIRRAIEYAEDLNTELWNPFQNPSEEELIATYYVEDGIFRVETLWDLLAQISNIKFEINMPSNKIYMESFFKKLKKQEKASVFATRVCDYMNSKNECNPEQQGSYSYIREYRNKMTHRFSPNITSISNYSLEMRIPAFVLLKNLVEDYKQVTSFIKELLSEVLKDYKDQNPKRIWITRR